jgi:hypothetical protein
MLAALALTMLAACAAGPETAPPPRKEAPEYITGSNIPRRDGRAANRVTTVDPSDVKDAGPAAAR